MTEAIDQYLPEPTALPVSSQQCVDFDRPVVSILGLPFDAVGLAQAVERIRHDALAGRRCFVSTPNLNFAISAHRDVAFRGSILRSDLSLADGMPLVWIARLLRLPVRERVSGADVFGALQAHSGTPISVFLFGGQPGAAARACEGINRIGGGLHCVGFDQGGFGGIESMSVDALIQRINASGAQFVLVSLGAKKGQAWIEHNADRLTAPVLSHFGAVLNFAAGKVRRAPRWMQRTGLEWFWRIREEPELWRRYWLDGSAGLLLLLTRILPDAMASRRTPGNSGAAPRLDAAGTTLRMSGDWHDSETAPLRAALTAAADRAPSLTVDLSGVTFLGPVGVALLLIARGWFDARGGLQVTGASAALARSLHRKLAARALLGNR